MAKKRGKKSKSTSKRHIRKVKTAKNTVEKTSEAPKPIKDTLRELELLTQEKKVEHKINGIEKKEEEIEKKEETIVKEEAKIEKETEKVEKLEKEIKKEVSIRPLTRFNMKDINKGIIGAFIGVVAHFAFIYGKEIAKDISTLRATVLIVFSYVLIILLMYETGYRDIREKRLLKVLPRRATAIFLTSIVIIFVIFFLFNQIDLSDISGLYKQIAVTSVLAALGAGTADLIGRD